MEAAPLTESVDQTDKEGHREGAGEAVDTVGEKVHAEVVVAVVGAVTCWRPAQGAGECRKRHRGHGASPATVRADSMAEDGDGLHVGAAESGEQSCRS